MKNTIVSIGAVMAAILVVASAGCVTPSAGSSSSPGTPVVTAEKSISGTPALPGSLPVANPLATTPTTGEAGNPLVAGKGDTVAVYYTGTFENGTVFDSNMKARTPVVFMLGNSTVIDGIDEAVTGMAVNEEKTVFIPAEKAYGAYNTSLIRTVNRTGPIANTTFVEGQYYTIHDKASDTYSTLKILKVTPTTVTWDANNPLAGLNFTFTLKLVKITRV